MLLDIHNLSCTLCLGLQLGRLSLASWRPGGGYRPPPHHCAPVALRGAVLRPPVATCGTARMETEQETVAALPSRLVQPSKDFSSEPELFCILASCSSCLQDAILFSPLAPSASGWFHHRTFCVSFAPFRTLPLRRGDNCAAGRHSRRWSTSFGGSSRTYGIAGVCS